MCSFEFFYQILHQICFNSFYSKISIYIKLSLTLSYSRKQSKYLHEILSITSVRLSTRFDNEVAINHALSINFILLDIVTTLSLPSLSIFITSFSIRIEKVFCIFAKKFNIFPQICLLILFKLIRFFVVLLKIHKNFSYNLPHNIKYACFLYY